MLTPHLRAILETICCRIIELIFCSRGLTLLGLQKDGKTCKAQSLNIVLTLALNLPFQRLLRLRDLEASQDP